MNAKDESSESGLKIKVEKKLSTKNLDEMIELNGNNSNNESYTDSLENLNLNNEININNQHTINIENNSCTTSSTSISSNRNSSVSSSSGAGAYDIENATNSFMLHNSLNKQLKLNDNDENQNEMKHEDVEESNNNINNQEKLNEEINELKENYDEFNENDSSVSKNSSLIKRTHLKNLIYEIYDIKNNTKNSNKNENETLISKEPTVLMEGFLEKLPHGKSLPKTLFF
jgi:hypothetical protein